MYKGFLRSVRNRLKSVKAKGSLTVRQTSRTETKVGLSDLTVQSGMAVTQRIKVTLGITGWSPHRVPIDEEVWHLDVGSSHPGGEVPPKGLAVRQLKRYVSWVQNVARQFGPYPAYAFKYWEWTFSSTRGPRRIYLWSTSYRARGTCWVATYSLEKCWKHLSMKPSSRWVLVGNE